MYYGDRVSFSYGGRGREKFIVTIESFQKASTRKCLAPTKKMFDTIGV